MTTVCKTYRQSMPKEFDYRKEEPISHPVSFVLHRILLMALQGNGPVTIKNKLLLMLPN